MEQQNLIVEMEDKLSQFVLNLVIFLNSGNVQCNPNSPKFTLNCPHLVYILSH